MDIAAAGADRGKSVYGPKFGEPLAWLLGPAPGIGAGPRPGALLPLFGKGGVTAEDRAPLRGVLGRSQELTRLWARASRGSFRNFSAQVCAEKFMKTLCFHFAGELVLGRICYTQIR